MHDETNMTHSERMAAGLWYDANYDPTLLGRQATAKDLVNLYNATPYANEDERAMLLRKLLGEVGEGTRVLSPVMVDYGSNVRIGSGSYLNHGAYLMDCAPITIGDNVFVGPNFGAYTAQHPLLAKERNTGLERALPITIEDDCWLGADVAVMPGVTIGRGCVIGARSLVTKSMPAGYLCMGSPCRPVRPITDADTIGEVGAEN